MDYENKHVLAPMVRAGTLPFRLLAAQYGADITYGEEIIDHKMVKCERRTNDSLGTTDFVERGTENVVFRTCSEERNRVVFQMGTSDAIRALTTAQILCKDVAAIDINMGCPKSFSISGGMGAALLSKPEFIRDILTTLRRNLDIPVTSVGKTSLVHLILKGSSIAHQPQTIRCTIGLKVAHPVASKVMQKGTSLLCSRISPVMNGVIFVNDLSQRLTKTSLHKWTAEVAATGSFSTPLGSGGPGGIIVPYLVIGNKADVASNEKARGSSGRLDAALQWVEKGLLPSSEELPLTDSF